MFKKYSLKKQFIITIGMVIGFSIISVLITIGLFFWSFQFMLNSKYAKPANYYEEMVPAIRNLIKKEETKILNSSYKEVLDRKFPSDGIKYRVINLKNDSYYGNLEENIDMTKSKIIEKINMTDISSKNKVMLYIPVINNDLTIEGVVVIQYYLKIYSEKIPNLVFKIMQMIMLISPFIYIIIYSYILGRRLSKSINEPLNELKLASNKVKNNDLDFELSYPFKNELGEVVSSFEEMRVELKESLEKQWKMEDDRKEIIGGLSHDLRSPLTVINGKVDLLLEGSYKDEERLIKYLKSIHKSTDRAIMLVNDLNTISKIENPEFTINVSENLVLNFLNSKIEEYNCILEEKNITLKLITEGIKEDTVWNFDKWCISRVLDNIVMNALRYTEENGRIVIKTKMENDLLKFDISDDGVGFSSEDLKRALDKFYKGDKSRSGAGSSGLGLYISRIIIEKHKGKFRIRNNDTKGAVVQFYI